MLLGPACGESAEPPPEPTYAPAPTATSAPTPTATPTPQARSQGVAFRWEGVPAGTDAAPPAQAPALPGGAIGFSHYVFEQVGGNVVTTLVEGRAICRYVCRRRTASSRSGPTPAPSPLT